MFRILRLLIVLSPIFHFLICSPSSGQEFLKVQGWDNSYTWNQDETGISAWNVRFEAQGNTINGSLNYRVYDRDNPTAIVQLFIAVEREVVAVIYNGIPGSRGYNGYMNFSFRFDRNRHGTNANIYLAGTWAYTVEQGKYHYEYENGGWRCSIGKISVSIQQLVPSYYTIKVTDQYGYPVPGISLGVYTTAQSLVPSRTDSMGKTKFIAEGDVKIIVAYDPERRFAPKVLCVDYPASEYSVRMDIQDYQMNKKMAENLLNQLLSAISLVSDLAQLLGKLPGHPIGFPGLFSLTPCIKDGQIGFCVSGVLADYLFSLLPFREYVYQGTVYSY